MRDLILQLNCSFTDADKEKCVPTIQKIVELANLARKKGILALELETEEEQSIFLKTALQLIVDGTDPVLVKQILQNLILADRHFGSQLLDRLIMAEGVLALQQGENPYIISLKLSAILGEKYILTAREAISAQENRISSYINLLKTLKNQEALPESAPFEEKVLQYDNRSIQHILQSMDRQYLMPALHGCGFNLIYRILDNVSLGTCGKICDNWEIIKPLRKESILMAQEKMLKTIETLEKGGEIINIRDINYR